MVGNGNLLSRFSRMNIIGLMEDISQWLQILVSHAIGFYWLVNFFGRFPRVYHLFFRSTMPSNSDNQPMDIF